MPGHHSLKDYRKGRIFCQERLTLGLGDGSNLSMVLAIVSECTGGLVELVVMAPRGICARELSNNLAIGTGCSRTTGNLSTSAFGCLPDPSFGGPLIHVFCFAPRNASAVELDLSKS